MAKSCTALSPTAAFLAFLLSGCAPQALFEGIVSVDAAPPTYLSAAMPENNRLDLSFSEEVRIVSLRFSPELAVAEVADGEKTVRVRFLEPVGAGQRCVFDATAEDPEGNSVSVLAPFVGRNDRPPALLISELRTEYSKPKVEFVELFIEEAGELGGLRLVSAGTSAEAPLFVFPPCAVAAGEYVVVHLRSIEEGLADETEALDASAGTDSSPAARDFWVAGAEKRLRRTDSVAMLDSDGGYLDAVAFSEAPDGPWTTDAQAAFAQSLETAGAWNGPAAANSGATATRTLGRRPAGADTNGKDDWAVAATGGASPGRPNADAFYVPSARSAKKR